MTLVYSPTAMNLVHNPPAYFDDAPPRYVDLQPINPPPTLEELVEALAPLVKWMFPSIFAEPLSLFQRAKRAEWRAFEAGHGELEPNSPVSRVLQELVRRMVDE